MLAAASSLQAGRSPSGSALPALSGRLCTRDQLAWKGTVVTLWSRWFRLYRKLI